MDEATAHNAVTELLIKSFIPKMLSEDTDSPSYTLIRRGLATITDDVFRIAEDLYEGKKAEACNAQADCPKRYCGVKTDMEEVVKLIEEWAHQDGIGDFKACKTIHDLLVKKEYIDD